MDLKSHTYLRFPYLTEDKHAITCQHVGIFAHPDQQPSFFPGVLSNVRLHLLPAHLLSTPPNVGPAYTKLCNRTYYLSIPGLVFLIQGNFTACYTARSNVQG